MTAAPAEPWPDHPSPRETWRRGAMAALVCACVALGWRGYAAHLWERIFPRFAAAGSPLWDRLTPTSFDACLPLLTLLVAAGLAWRTWRRVGAPARPTVASVAGGTLLLLIAAALQGVSLAAGIGFTSGVALLGVVVALLLTAGGWTLVRAYAAPLLLLVFAVPLPMVWVAGLTLSLKLWAADWALAAADVLVGLEATRVGSYVMLPPAALTGPPVVVSVDDACSGIRSLATLTWVACVFACVRPLGTAQRLCVLAAAIPLALACNVARIAMLLTFADSFGADAIAAGAPLHDWLGVATFLLALGALFALEAPLKATPMRPRRPVSPPRFAMPVGGAMPAALLAVVAVLSLAAPRPAAAGPAAAIDWSPLARPLVIDGRRYAPSVLPIPGRVHGLLGTDAVWHTRFIADDDRAAFDVLIVHHASARQAVHPPEVCLRAAGQQLTPGGQVAIGPAATPFRRLIASRDQARVEHLYTFRVGERYTTDFLTHQALAALTAWAGDPEGVALVRVSAAGDSAETLAQRAAAALIPSIDAALP